MSPPQPVPVRHDLVRQVLIDLAVMTVIGLVLALIGPFGSFELPFAWRLVYWVGLAWAGYGCYRPIGALVTRLGPRYDLPHGALWGVACLIATVPMTVIVVLAASPLGSMRMPAPETWLAMYGYVLAIGAPVTLLFYALAQRGNPQSGQPAEPAPKPLAEVPPTASTPRLFSRLSPALGQELVALEMEDHYMRVHTALGSELILLRMRDALGEVQGIEGAQIHRSWWVARRAVQGTERDGRNLRLVLRRAGEIGEVDRPVAREVPVHGHVIEARTNPRLIHLRHIGQQLGDCALRAHHPHPAIAEADQHLAAGQEVHTERPVDLGHRLHRIALSPRDDRRLGLTRKGRRRDIAVA